MEAGTQVWSYEDSGDDPWILSQVIDRTADAIQVKHLSGEDSDSFSRPLLPSSSGEEGAKYQGIELANAPLSEADAAEGADNDMIALQHLHEPAILHAVSERYFRGEVYTWTGPVLIAVNPFQRLPLYTREILESYQQEGLLCSQGLSDSSTKALGPHVYSIADRSYRQMMSEQRKSQSILISGESGAGKTETTKIVMLYLTTLGSADNEEEPDEEIVSHLPRYSLSDVEIVSHLRRCSLSNVEIVKHLRRCSLPNAGIVAHLPRCSLSSGVEKISEEGPAVEVGVEEISDGGGKKLSIMERVLQSNPILEAFGNAKTLRNDNSSRFGKFIELGFNRAGILQGAKVQTYLLEKVRIGYHGSGERNYHIFYQLLRGATEEQHHKYCFHGGLTGGLELANYFHLTGQGGAPQLREFTDEDGLKYTLKSMRSMGWKEDKIDHVLSIIAGILHLGQVKFESKMSDGGQEIASIADEKTVADAAKLLGVDLDKLITALTVRIMVTRGDEIRIDLDPTKASEARDSLAQTVFGAMFLWVVKQVNDCIMWEDDKDIRSSVGVLDIFGFESFATNSFEQLCINFANEALQQQFNKFIFKLEQEEYERENINWAFIEFPDNQDCLDTITARPKGILAMLDDQCKLGQRGSNKNWAKRLNDTYLPEKNQTISDNTRYSATKMQQAKGIFCVRHFAGNVEYTAETNFLEKNRDEISLTAKSLFEQGCTDLIKEIYDVQKDQSEEKESDKVKGKPAKQKTVSQQFKVQLNSLIEMVEKTDPHYIRCLKPNDAAKPKLMTRKRLTEQLRYGGVLEAVRVARMGYPIRLDHTGFFKRYRMLLPSVPDDVFPWSMEDSNQEPQTLCVKFLDLLLEEGAKLVNYAEEDGSMSRVNKIRMGQRQPEPMDFPKTDVQLGLSKVFMRKGPHDKLESHRVFHQNASITLIQSWVRGLQQERRYLIKEDAALNIERWYRGCIGRACWWKLREAQASLLLTNTFRMQIKRSKYNRARSGTVRLQAQFRGRTIRKVNAATNIQSFRRTSSVRAEIASSLGTKFGKSLELASLQAKLQAQAASDEVKAENEKAIFGKQKEIDRLDARIVDLAGSISRSFDEPRDTKSRALNDPPVDTREKMEDADKSDSDHFPLIKTGFIGEEKKEGAAEVVAVGRKHDVASRKEREEGPCDEVRVSDSKVERFYPLLEKGIDVTVWQLNKSAEVGVDGPGGGEFAVKSSSMTLKLHRKAWLVQTVFTLNSNGGYLSKALGRRRDKAAHEPLLLNDILEIKAGCVGFDHAELPSSSTKKGKSSALNPENMQSSLFMTIKATSTPVRVSEGLTTPMASSRFYFLRLKSETTRNDLLSDLHGILADLQAQENSRRRIRPRAA